MPLPSVIPPRSVVALVRADATTPAWRERVGEKFRVGYYSPNDGLDVIWLVDGDGRYAESVDPAGLLRHFSVDRLSDQTDWFGVNRPPLDKLDSAERRRLRKGLAPVA